MAFFFIVCVFHVELTDMVTATAHDLIICENITIFNIAY
jgi:hypothetical protein